MGIGTSYLNPLFTDGTRHFSTRFNFDDHLGLGYRWGGEASHFGSQEVTLRLEHFSNAGLREPNPGMNFIELRYGHDL
jgi:hypothetical protein